VEALIGAGPFEVKSMGHGRHRQEERQAVGANGNAEDPGQLGTRDSPLFVERRHGSRSVHIDMHQVVAGAKEQSRNKRDIGRCLKSYPHVLNLGWCVDDVGNVDRDLNICAA
jgi:hypothetical protein